MATIDETETMGQAQVLLADRRLVRVTGEAATAFLQNILTADLAGMESGEARAGALLTPQGKILADGIVIAGQDGCLIDCAGGLADGLVRRLLMYRLRARLQIATDDGLAVVWCPGAAAVPDALVEFADPRHPGLGRRAVVPTGAAPAASGVQAFRRTAVALGIAEAGVDFAPDQVFPHEASHDLLHGVSFSKGCFIGQEVVSRMEHRGTARKRFLPCLVEGQVPAPGTEVRAGDRPLGQLGSSAGDMALALLRLDRLAAAVAAGLPLTAGGATLTPRRPDWADFEVPQLPEPVR